MNPKQKKAMKAKLIEKFGLKCWWCGRCFSEEKLTFEHLLPRSEGGSNSFENLRLAWKDCNHARGNSLYPPDECVFPS